MTDEKDGTRRLSRRDALEAMGMAGAGVLLVSGGAQAVLGADTEPAGSSPEPYDWNKHYWGFAVDINKCIGCNACMRACREENSVPEGSFRTWVERYRIMKNGDVMVDVALNDEHVFEPVEGDVEKAFFVPKLCNHCERSVCTQVCPVGATYDTKDGVVLVDRERCIGCGYCVQACPYGTRFISHAPGADPVADKCTLCYHRITKGLQPACVEACPRDARVFGDLRDPKSHLSILLRQNPTRTLKTEMGTHPKCHYIGLDREVI